MNKRPQIIKQCMTAFGIAINIAGAFIAMNLHLPIYMDSIGTVINAALLGPGWAVATGLLGSILSGVLFDVYSFYFAPVQIFTGLIAGYLFKTKWLHKKYVPVGTLAFSLPVSLVSAMISAFVFGGITSSGSSFLVQIMTKAGMNLTMSCFIVQIITDYADKLAAVLIVSAVMAAMGSEMRNKLRGSVHGQV